MQHAHSDDGQPEQRNADLAARLARVLAAANGEPA